MADLAQLDEAIFQEMKDLSETLHPAGYPFKAGFLESLILSLPVDLGLTKQQLAKMAEVLRRRRSDFVISRLNNL
jgi:hypothetical protein